MNLPKILPGCFRRFIKNPLGPWCIAALAATCILMLSRSSAQELAAKGKYLEPIKDPRVELEPGSDVGNGRYLSREGGEQTDPIFRIYSDYPSVRGSLGRLMGNRRDPDFKDPEGKVVAFEVLKNGDVLFGPNVGIARRPDRSGPDAQLETNPQHTSPIDFYWDARDRKLHVRSILLTENGDPADLAFRRSGDETYPYGPPMGIRKGTNLGTMYWMGWGANDYGFDDRVAQIYAKAAEDITAKGAGGTLHFSTTAVGTTTPLDRMVISSEGQIGVGTTAPQAQFHVATKGSGTAEDYPAAEKLEPGDVVAVDGNASSLSVIRASKPYDSKVVGVVAAMPAIRISHSNSAAAEDDDASPIIGGYPVAHTGRTAVKVSAENGAIRPGDYLTSSGNPGVAMKATKKGPVIGKALQSYSSEGTGQIQMLADVTWYHP